MYKNRRDVLKILGAGATVSALGCTSKGLTTSKKKRPNIVLIFTDDQGYEDLGCFNSPDIETPHIDQMSLEGMRFTDFYVGSSVCTPSRAALLTGCYPKRVGCEMVFWPKGDQKYVNNPDNWKMGLHPQIPTISSLLKENNYQTACIGKWHLGDMKPF